MSTADTSERLAMEKKERAAVELLRHLLLTQIERHNELLALVQQKREAIRQANLDAVGVICERENAAIIAAQELEQKRLIVVESLAPRFGLKTGGGTRMADLCEQLPEPQSGQIAALTAQLRDIGNALKKESSIVRAAGEALSRHMTGIMQTVQSALSQAGVYSKGGAVDHGAQVQFSVDVKS